MGIWDLFENIEGFIYTWNCIRFEMALDFGFIYESQLAEYIPYNYKDFVPSI